MENSKSFEEEDWFPHTPDIDLDDVAEQIEDSLVMAAALTTRLGELNREMVEFVANNTMAKASTK